MTSSEHGQLGTAVFWYKPTNNDDAVCLLLWTAELLRSTRKFVWTYKNIYYFSSCNVQCRVQSPCIACITVHVQCTTWTGGEGCARCVHSCGAAWWHSAPVSVASKAAEYAVAASMTSLYTNLLTPAKRSQVSATGLFLEEIIAKKLYILRDES